LSQNLLYFSMHMVPSIYIRTRLWSFSYADEPWGRPLLLASRLCGGISNPFK
jgi:hypothetical protein